MVVYAPEAGDLVGEWEIDIRRRWELLEPGQVLMENARP